MRTGCLGLAVLAFSTGAATADALTLAHLAPRPDLMPDVAALPRLTNPGPVAARINARLAELDTASAHFARACDTEPPGSNVERLITVTYTGPGFLSLLDSGGYYCPGAAHPNHGVTPLTFDLATGAEVDFRTLLPQRLWIPSDYVWPGSLKATPALVALYLAQPGSLPQDCRDAIARPPVWFQLWFQASPPGIVVIPSSLPYSMQACADPVTLPVPVLRQNGFAVRVIAALGG